jgi:CheY-like chemotaxis protein
LICETVIKRQFPQTDVHFAENGEDGLGLFLEWDIFNQNMPDIIFLDINMPVMDGWEFLNKINERFANRFPDLPIVMMSSTIDPNDQKRALNNRWVQLFLSKPLTVEKLMLTIKELG